MEKESKNNRNSLNNNENEKNTKKDETVDSRKTKEKIEVSKESNSNRASTSSRKNPRHSIHQNPKFNYTDISRKQELKESFNATNNTKTPSHPSTKVEKPDADEIGKISNRVPCDGIVRENKPQPSNITTNTETRPQYSGVGFDGLPYTALKTKAVEPNNISYITNLTKQNDSKVSKLQANFELSNLSMLSLNTTGQSQSQNFDNSTVNSIDSGINETPADLEIDNSTVNENVQQSRQIYSNMDSSTQNSIETNESRDIELSSSNQQHIEFQNVENDTLADTISLPTENDDNNQQNGTSSSNKSGNFKSSTFVKLRRPKK